MRVLLTGMSGSGKSTVIARLAELGHRAIDLDGPGWSEWARLDTGGCFPGAPPELDWIWREDRVRELLDASIDAPIFVSGCAPNQGRFADRFDHIVLLTAPVDVLFERVRARTTNRFGRTAAERAKIAADTATIEPLLRKSANLEIDTSTATVDDVVERVLDLTRRP